MRLAVDLSQQVAKRRWLALGLAQVTRVELSAERLQEGVNAADVLDPLGRVVG